MRRFTSTIHLSRSCVHVRTAETTRKQKLVLCSEIVLVATKPQAVRT
jgi:hypothetical protein